MSLKAFSDKVLGKLKLFWQKISELGKNGFGVWKKLNPRQKLIFMISTGGVVLVGLLWLILAPLFNHGVNLVGIDPNEQITIKTNLTFSFNGDIVEAGMIGNTFGGELIKFTPAIPGRFRYVSRRELRFLPEAPLKPSTKYQAELKPEVVRLRDRYLTGKKMIEFTTEQFKLENADLSFAFPEEQQRGVQLQARLNFNYPVDPVLLRKRIKLRLTEKKRTVGFTIDATQSSNKILLTSEPLLMGKDEQQIELMLGAGFKCVNGSIGLKDSFAAKTAVGSKKALSIIEAIPKADDNNCWIALHCSEPADEETITNYLRIKPQVPFRVELEGEYILIKSEKFKSNDNYTVEVKAGLPSLNGFPLKRDFKAGIFFGDLEPSLKFNAPGRYLSSKGYLNLGLETVNIDRVNVEISQIFANNIVPYLNNSSYDDEWYSSDISKVGRVVKSEIINVDNRKNELNTLPINLGEYLKNFRGIFQVVAYDEDNRWRQDSKYVVITDLGISAKMAKNELMVWVNSLESLEAKANVKVSLISKNNQVLATANTDSQGIARFNGIKKSADGFESFIVLAEQGDDFAFIHLASSLISLADFEVRGREHLESGYEAFLYFDRDIFRPGDNGNLVAVVRGPNGVMPPEFPVKLELRGPDGQIFREFKSSTSERGACEFALAIPDYAQTGRYTANLYVAEQVIGTSTLSVEDFMPERIKVTTKTDKTAYNAGDTAALEIEGMNLFGPPAAGRRAEMRVQLEAVPFTANGFGSYTFGDSSREFKTKEEELGESKLDENGLTSYKYEFPRGFTPAAKLQAVFQATVVEDGGRAVSNYKVVDFHPYNCYIGVKPLAEYYCEVGKPYQLKYVVLGQDGKPLSNPELKVEVYRITWNSIYRKNEDGKFEYASVEEKERVYQGDLSGKSGEQLFQYTPKDYGEYLVQFTEPTSQSRASLNFYASGWGYSPWAMADPDKIELDLDKKSYRVGDEVKVQIKAPFAGKALITIEREKVYETKIVELKENTALVTLSVKQEYKPNVYISVQLIRSIKSLEKKAPVRAFGVIPLQVDCTEHQMKLSLDVPKEIRPEREVEIGVKAIGGSGNAYLTLAAVDEGICQLTNYNVPEPMGFFYGRRSLDIASYDLYSMILPEVESAKVKSTPGGDASLDRLRKQNLNPVSARRVKPVSLWSGLVKLDAAGEAKIKFKVPQFNGTLRLMAVTSSGNKFGSLQKKILVRDPIVINPTFPRFVAPADQFAVPVTITNATGKDGEFTVNLKADGPVELQSEASQKITLKKQEEKSVFFQLRAKNTLGRVKFKVEAEGNGQVCKVNEELPLRPAAPLSQEYFAGSINVSKPFSLELDEKWLPGTGKAVLTLAPFPAMKFAGSLKYLLSYPHGCVEQTTSKVFPLLYFDDLARATKHEVFKGGNAEYFITQGIEKLEAMQLRDGSFAYWPGGKESSDWGSIYASHFLVEARKAGYNVSERVYSKLIASLLSISKSKESSNYQLELKAYALYVLSLAGKPQLSTMSYLRHSALNKLDDYSRAQLAAAYYYAGERKTAKNILPVTLGASHQVRESGGNFNSAARADAIVLSVLADVDPGNPAVYKLVTRLSKEAAEVGAWGTTQENAFALMALGKTLAKKSDGSYQGEVLVNGTKLASFDESKELRLEDRRLSQGKITVKLNGNGVCYYFLESSGISEKAELKTFDQGITVRREFLDRNGKKLNPNQIKQGDLVVVDLALTPGQAKLENLAVVDMLPAGLEIENPRIASSASLAWLSKATVKPDYLDIRDDRLMLFVSLKEKETVHFYYAVRAVTCGEFLLPAVKAECMYEPEIASYAAPGKIKIIRND